MNLKTQTTDMLHGPLTGKMLLFALPVALGSIVQQLFNAADTAVVGYFGAAELYLRLYLLGYPFLLLYDFASAVLRARGDSRYPFWALVLSGIVNVGFNLIFVLVFRMGVAGVAIATDISTLLSALMVLHRLRGDAPLRPVIRRLQSFLYYTAEILKTGIPSAVQGAVFCFANLFVQASVNRFGETAIAGSTIAMNLEYVTYYVITAFGQTATTFTS